MPNRRKGDREQSRGQGRSGTENRKEKLHDNAVLLLTMSAPTQNRLTSAITHSPLFRLAIQF